MRRSRRRGIRALLADERGLSTVEYVIILALVAIVGVLIWQMAGRHVAERNRHAGRVVDGLATSSSVEEHGGGGRRAGAGGDVDLPAGGSSAPDLGERPEPPPPENNVWRWMLLAGCVFGGMIFWLAKEKSA